MRNIFSKKKILVLSLLVVLACNFLGFYTTTNKAYAETDISKAEQQKKLEEIATTGGGVTLVKAGAASVAENAFQIVANIGKWGSAMLLDIVVSVVAALLWFVYWILQGILFLAEHALNEAITISVVDFSQFASIPVIYDTWKIGRDLSNIFLIFVMIKASIMVMVGREKMASTLPQVIFVALFINFSYPFTRFIIDVTNVITLEFWNKMFTADGSFVTLIHASLAGIADFGDAATTMYANSTAQTAGSAAAGVTAVSTAIRGYFVQYVMVNILLVTTIATLLAYAYLFFQRLIQLLGLIIFSSFAFLMSLFPQGSGYYKEWWSKLTSQTIWAPASLFFLYVTFGFVGKGEVLTMIKDTTYVFSSPVADALNLKMALPIFVYYTIISMFLMASLTIAKEIGAVGADKAMKFVEGWRDTAINTLKAGAMGGLNYGMRGGLIQQGAGAISRGLQTEGAQQIASRVGLQGTFANISERTGKFSTEAFGTQAATDDAKKVYEQSLKNNPQAQADYFKKLTLGGYTTLSQDTAASQGVYRAMSAPEREALKARLKSQGDTKTMNMIAKYEGQFTGDEVLKHFGGLKSQTEKAEYLQSLSEAGNNRDMLATYRAMDPKQQDEIKKVYDQKKSLAVAGAVQAAKTGNTAAADQFSATETKINNVLKQLQSTQAGEARGVEATEFSPAEQQQRALAYADNGFDTKKTAEYFAAIQKDKNDSVGQSTQERTFRQMNNTQRTNLVRGYTALINDIDKKTNEVVNNKNLSTDEQMRQTKVLEDSKKAYVKAQERVEDLRKMLVPFEAKGLENEIAKVAQTASQKELMGKIIDPAKRGSITDADKAVLQSIKASELSNEKDGIDFSHIIDTANPASPVPNAQILSMMTGKQFAALLHGNISRSEAETEALRQAIEKNNKDAETDPTKKWAITSHIMRKGNTRDRGALGITDDSERVPSGPRLIR